MAGGFSSAADVGIPPLAPLACSCLAWHSWCGCKALILLAFLVLANECLLLKMRISNSTIADYLADGAVKAFYLTGLVRQ